MSKVQLVTFKGRQSTINFRTELENLIETEKLDLEIEMILLPSPAAAGDGSGTVPNPEAGGTARRTHSGRQRR